MANKDKEHAQRQQQWKRENDSLLAIRKEGQRMKALARSRGYQLKYFDYLDSYERAFNEIALAARTEYPSLLTVAEVSWDDYSREADQGQQRYGIGEDWEHVVFLDENEAVTTYNDRDTKANINGQTRAYQQPDGRVRTLVLIPESVRCNFQHRDFKYHIKLIALLHELGHVRDMDQEVNFHFADRRADIIAAEVYAHRFAINEANRLGLLMVAVTLVDSLKQYFNGSDYRAEVAKQTLADYTPPATPIWMAFTEGDMSGPELAMLKKMSR